MYYVLYADSDERSRQMACGYRLWQESGFCLKAETGSGEEALNLLKKDYFDLVITDLRMMAGEGILLAEAMKRQGCTASLVLSGSLCSFESAREGMRLGALDFIPKPVTERKLSEALEGIEPELRKRKIRAGSFRKETVEQAEIEALYREILSGQMENEVLEGWIKRLLETLGKESGQVHYCIADNNAVSRCHAELLLQDGSWWVRDLNSTNKTYLNGCALTPGELTQLSDGAVLRLANEEFTVRIEE